MTTYKVKVSGHQIDLTTAENAIKCDMFSIVQIGTEYFICSNNFNDLSDSNDLFAIAEEILEIINSSLTITVSGFKALKLEHLYIKDNNGEISKVVNMSTNMTGRGHLTASLSTNNLENVGSSISLTSTLINKIKEKPTLADVLHFYSTPITWNNLYKIYEIIHDDIGDEVKIITGSNQLSRFKGTAQSRKLIGDEARHASKYIIGTQNPMTIMEACELINNLIFVWTKIK